MKRKPRSSKAKRNLLSVRFQEWFDALQEQNPDLPVQTLLQRQQEVFLTIYNSTLKALGIVR